jgi:hypothetical protein
MSSFSPPAAPLWRWLYTQNPFYLIGTLLILFGLQQSAGGDQSVLTSGLLPALLSGYILLLSGIAILIIRGGQVWDDARTILLVIVLLFFILSASLDVMLVESFRSGTVLAVAALGFAWTVSEGLLRLLRIHLAPRYRTPYYLMLTLLFLFPAVPAWLRHQGLEQPQSWAGFAFPGLMGLALLTLLPAARTRRRREPASGTPWLWPFYPWSLFVFLTIGAGLRAWWLTISFEPVDAPQSTFHPYVLLPLFLAWSALLVEMGKARRSYGAITAGMALPLAGLACCFAAPTTDPNATALLSNVAPIITSPLQLAVGALLIFYFWAWSRNVRAAEGFLVVVGLAASVVSSETIDLSSLARPNPMPLAIVAGSLLLLAIYKKSSWRAIAAGAMAIAGARYAGMGVLSEETLHFWQWHAPLLGLMTLSTLFRDELAAGLRELSWRAAPVLALIAALIYPWALPGVTPPLLASYLGLLLLVSISLWQRQKEVGPLVATLTTGSANVLIYLGLLYALLQQSPLSRGLPFLAGGLAAVAAALAISLLKMGVWRQMRYWVDRLNLKLGGSAVGQGSLWTPP